MSENLPDFDSMSPEEMQTWLESLAKRQGASEGFTTSADMDVAEIDPNSVVIDEPGYVPYGEDAEQLRAVAPAAQVTPPEPVSEPPPSPAPMPGVTGTLAWLESLAADRNEDIFNLDLSDSPVETTPEPEPEPAAPVSEAPSVNPIAWLEDLARSQVAEESLERLGADDDSEESEKLDPFAQGVNPMEWLETLAKRQGAKDEELTTDAQMNIPEPVDAEVEQDDYQPFSFDTPPARHSAETASLENPAEWLESLAGEEGYSEEGVRATQKPDDKAAEEDMSLSAIQDAIAAGTVTREQMQYFLEQQSEQLEHMPETMDEAVTDDTPLEPAELPDWLSEMKPSESAPEPSKPIEELFETPPSAEVPDWLQPDFVETPVSDDLESIFEPDEETPTSPEPVVMQEQPAAEAEADIDPDDPWTEAFEVEYEQGGELDVGTVPDWYEQNVSDPERITAVEEQIEAAELADAALPEEKGLAAAQPQAVPAWMTMTVSEQPGAPEPADANAETEESENVFAEMPDWLKEVESSVSPDDVPEWLVETITAEEMVDEPPAAEPVQAVQEDAEPPPPAPAPEIEAPPAPTYVPVGEAAAVFERARSREQSGDLDGALSDYEAMIRSSTELEAVVAELTQLVRSYKTTPAVYRVLGDGLMRQGKLQAALNTYREALNQL